MIGTRGVLVVREDTAIVGEIRNCQRIEIYGHVEGQIAAESILVHEGGRFYGTVKSDNADVHGTMQGEVFIKHLISIRSSGSVSGNVRYGQLALEAGGNLSAEVRNVPPTLGGDLGLTVNKGRTVTITLEDLRAFDPDDKATDLIFSVSNTKNGFVSLSRQPTEPVSKFSQADLQSGTVLFRHDGTNTPKASFDVVVADHAGATSGNARTVQVSVSG
ncbi:MAG: polymer-forming cytoskeletal protein [Hyphomicrobiaceae bacterium]